MIQTVISNNKTSPEALSLCLEILEKIPYYAMKNKKELRKGLKDKQLKIKEKQLKIANKKQREEQNKILEKQKNKKRKMESNSSSLESSNEKDKLVEYEVSVSGINDIMLKVSTIKCIINNIIYIANNEIIINNNITLSFNYQEKNKFINFIKKHIKAYLI